MVLAPSASVVGQYAEAYWYFCQMIDNQDIQLGE
jgi:hypothetical protein